MHIVLIIALSVGIPLILLAVAGAYAYKIYKNLDTSLGEPVKKSVAALGPQVLGVALAVDGDFHINVLEGTAELGAISAANAKGFTHTPCLFQLDRVLLKVNMWLLFKSQMQIVEVDELVVEGLQVNLEVKNMRNNSMKGILEHLGKYSHTAAHKPAKAEELEPLKHSPHSPGTGPDVFLKAVRIAGIQAHSVNTVTGAKEKCKVNDVNEKQFSQDHPELRSMHSIAWFFLDGILKSVLTHHDTSASKRKAARAEQEKQEEEAERKAMEEASWESYLPQPVKSRTCDCAGDFASLNWAFPSRAGSHDARQVTVANGKEKPPAVSDAAAPVAGAPAHAAVVGSAAAPRAPTPQDSSLVQEPGLFQRPTVEVEGGGKYTGQWMGLVRHGYGVFDSGTGLKYKGQFIENAMEGQGRLELSDGRVYEGQWRTGKMSGTGILTNPDGTKYAGAFADNQKHGQGVFTWKDGSQYSGQWAWGKQHGNGTIRSSAGEEQHTHWSAGVLSSSS